MKKVIMLSIFMLAIVANSFALKIYAFLLGHVSPGCYSVLIVITENDHHGTEYVMASGTAMIGDCGGISGGSNEFITIDSTSPLKPYIHENDFKEYMRSWYNSQ